MSSVMTGVLWIDTHCHADAGEFLPDVLAVRRRAASVGVAMCVVPSVNALNMDTVRTLARQTGDAYSLGIHPLYVPSCAAKDLRFVRASLAENYSDPRLVAVGEIGLDFFVPSLCTPEMQLRQEMVYRDQLVLACEFDLPVILHVRRSADRLLKYLREVAGPNGRWLGIAHAFNGSLQQAEAFIELGFKLGFGGAVTFERALQLRALATQLPLDALVLETDAPDIPPHWLYVTQAQRAAGVPQGRNEPAELPRIGSVVASLRGMPVADLAAATTANALAALPKLRALMPHPGVPC